MHVFKVLGVFQELNRQDPLVDEVESKVDKAATDMKSTNSRLKETVLAVFTSP